MDYTPKMQTLHSNQGSSLLLTVDLHLFTVIIRQIFSEKELIMSAMRM